MDARCSNRCEIEECPVHASKLLGFLSPLYPSESEVFILYRSNL